MGTAMWPLTPRTRASQRRRRLRLGILASLLVHGTVIAGLSTWSLSRSMSNPCAIEVSAQFVDRASDSNPGGAVGLRLPQAQDVTATFVRQHLDAAFAQQRQVQPQEQVSRIEGMGAQLEQVSSQDSLREISGKFQSWLGYSERASRPDPAQPGEFDASTAQIHDVLLVRGADGRAYYEAVLLDAQGRTTQVPLEDGYGETVFQLMQRIKVNPLLEQLYREIFLPLADQLGHRAKAKPATAPAPTAAE